VLVNLIANGVGVVAADQVGNGGEFVGVLEDIDLLSFLAGNAQLVAGQIDRASSVVSLASAALFLSTGSAVNGIWSAANSRLANANSLAS